MFAASLRGQQELIAIKVFGESPKIPTVDGYAEWESEVEVLSELGFHPKICTALGVSELPLGILIKQFGSVSCQKASVVKVSEAHSLQDICLAVHHLSEHNFAHCDLKPSNVMIDLRDGQ